MRLEKLPPEMAKRLSELECPDFKTTQEDWNVVLPLDRLNELAAEGTIGSVAATHYSFMGATDPVQMASGAREVAGKLKADHVDAVLLTSV